MRPADTMIINSLLLSLILLSSSSHAAKKSERRVDQTSTSSAPVSTHEQEMLVRENVSVKTRIRQEDKEWPIREMIAILGESFWSLVSALH